MEHSVCISRADIDDMDRVHRLKLINGLSGFKSANLIGTGSKEDGENLAVFSSFIHLGSDPPLLGCILRPNTVPRHTWNNIKSEGWYTVNHINEDIYEQAHQTSGKYHKEISEFDVSDLTPWYSKKCTAPYVNESRINIGLKPIEKHMIEANQTMLLVGSIQEVWLNRSFIDTDGFLDIEKAGTVAVSGLDGYHSTSLLDKLDYVRVENEKSREEKE
ncbi:NADH-FMN oxidoreductase RutF, flavin reductase (DIM6/NTAB) family [Fodinibius salinus]|uniref:NADH-FMN oxidoreductase RutF, flavin reductase (DIM6/NTAB) family n=1 Tax=Fodinibius salinus TaxID=860790 RepID=A0A5D3YMG9_9BACT|nr:flavin reductase [Fodinibius salinus]TYP93887.1 NADH-FMN oxidoreductase RutF, flavin reductase (DIM6/NTAB) family [Fodinibius salinus]